MKSPYLALLALPMLGTIFQPPAPIHSVELTEWRADQGGNGHFYEAVESPAGITWDDAEAYAIAHTGYLATLTSSSENAFVFKLVDDADFWLDGPSGDSLGPWLGGTQSPASTPPDNSWEWSHGEGLFTYTNWSAHPQNNESVHKNHLCFYAESKSSRQPAWAGQPGDTKLHGFVVEYDSNPLPQSLGYVALFAVCVTGAAVVGCLLFLLFRKQDSKSGNQK